MKTKEEIEQLAQEVHYESQNQGLNADGCFNQHQGFIKGYTQCQEDMVKEFEKDGAELFKSEIRRAYIHGQGNAQAMEAGLERDETEDYVNYRMLSLAKNK